MSQESRSRTQTAVRTRPQRIQNSKVEAPRPGSQVVDADSASRLPIGGYRLLAALVLVLLLAFSLIVTRPPSAPDVNTLVTPNIDGSASVLSGMTSEEVARSMFRFVPVVERSQNTVELTNIADVLRFDPGSVRVRQVIVGQMYASSTGSLNQTLVQTGFFTQRSLISDIEAAYAGLMDSDTQAARGMNGLAVLAMVRSLDATGQERKSLERNALFGFEQALGTESKAWQLTYNWALANLAIGNYASAYEGLRGVISAASNDNNMLPQFWMGVAALRLGDPGAALDSFTRAINTKAPEGGNQAFQDLYFEAQKLANEGLADAQWANRDPASAYNTYYRLLHDSKYADFYPKWVRLGIQQRAYERLVNDMASLETEEGFRTDARIRHDRARLLTFLGRGIEAEAEYKDAIRLGQDDASLHISYGQALENGGDHNGALVQAETALRGLGRDPGSSDLSSVASAIVLSTTTPLDRYLAQQVLDAYLLRAHAWGKMGQTGNVQTLVNGITQQTGSLSQDGVRLLNLYAGFAAEAGGLSSEATGKYGATWDQLKGQPAGTSGRGAALAGLVRATSGANNPSAGLQALKDNGYDPSAPKSDIVNDPDAPDLLYLGARLFQQMGRDGDAANALRVAAIADNLQNIRQVTGFGRPIWYSTTAFTPSNAVLHAAEASGKVGDTQREMTILRYRQSFLLDPAQAPAWNNLGVLYAQDGKKALATSYFSLAGTVSPDYALARHNQAALEYRQGIGNFANAESAQGAAIKSVGTQSLLWGYNLRADNRGPYPAPVVPGQDLLTRLSALLILVLLLAHTLVGNDRIVKGLGLQPTRGVLGRLAVSVDGAARRAFPALVRPGSSMRSLLFAIIIPSFISMIGLAWLSGHGSLEVMLVFLPVALLVALLAFGANELAQYVAARRRKSVTLHHIWPTGALLGILSIPFGFLYGWQIVTRVQPAGAAKEDEEGANLQLDAMARHARTEEDLDLAYEAQLEAAAELAPAEAAATTIALTPIATGPLEMAPAVRILFAGLVANLALGLLFGLSYWLTAWPSMRLGMFASMLVLAFTSVSEPPADGWTLYRRNPLIWLGIFVFSALMVTLLATGLV